MEFQDFDISSVNVNNNASTVDDWSALCMLAFVAVKVAEEEQEENELLLRQVSTVNNNNNDTELKNWGTTKKRKPRPHCRRDNYDDLVVPPPKKKLKWGTPDKILEKKQMGKDVVNGTPRRLKVLFKNENNNNNSPPAMPERFKNAVLGYFSCISGHEGMVDHNLVIQKRLTKTDLGTGQNRFSIPVKKMSYDGFLNEEEKDYLCTRNDMGNMNYMEVKIIEPSLERGMVRLCRWEMNTSAVYNLNWSWKQIVERNKLEEGMTVQLWASKVQGELCFSLVKLP